jgi:hypothetical protein
VNTEGGAERFDEQGLRETGHALEKNVAIGEERDEQALDDVLVAQDGFGDFDAKFLRPDGTSDHGFK